MGKTSLRIALKYLDTRAVLVAVGEGTDARGVARPKVEDVAGSGLASGHGPVHVLHADLLHEALDQIALLPLQLLA